MTFWEQALLFRAVGTNSRSRRTRTTRFRGEVTSVVTNVQRHHLKNSAGEATRRADSGRDLSWFVLRGYASLPGALIPGRACSLRVFNWRSISSLSPPAKPDYLLLAVPAHGIHRRSQNLSTNFVQHFTKW